MGGWERWRRYESSVVWRVAWGVTRRRLVGVRRWGEAAWVRMAGSDVQVRLYRKAAVARFM